MPHSQTFLDLAEGGCLVQGRQSTTSTHGGATRISTRGYKGGYVEKEGTILSEGGNPYIGAHGCTTLQTFGPWPTTCRLFVSLYTFTTEVFCVILWTGPLKHSLYGQSIYKHYNPKGS